MPNVLAETYASGQVAEAADITMSTLQNWLKRGVIIGHRDIGGGGARGRHRRFTFFNVMEVATAAALTKLGVADLPLAFNAAATFAHSGEGELPGRPARLPSAPYRASRTLLAFAGTRVEVMPYVLGEDVLAVIRADLGRPEGVILLDLNDLFDRVCARLSMHPEAVMDQVYGAGHLSSSNAAP